MRPIQRSQAAKGETGPGAIPGRIPYMGSERQGLPAELEEVARTIVRIPMTGCVDSLNLAVATAVVLYESNRQQRLTAAIEG